MRTAATAYLADLENGVIEKAPATVGRYRSVINHRLLRDGSMIADMRLADVTVADVRREYRAICQAGGHSHLRHARAILNYVFQEVVDELRIPRGRGR